MAILPQLGIAPYYSILELNTPECFTHRTMQFLTDGLFRIQIVLKTVGRWDVFKAAPCGNIRQLYIWMNILIIVYLNTPCYSSPLTTPSLDNVCLKHVERFGYSCGNVCILTWGENIDQCSILLVRITLRVSRGWPVYTEAVAPRDPATKSIGTSYREPAIS